MQPAFYAHPRALVESTEIGSGTRIWAFTHVCRGAVIGRDCNVGEGCFVEGGSRIGDRVTVKNGVMVWEGVSVEDDVFIGPCAVFTNDLRPRSGRSPAAAHRYGTKAWLRRTVVGRGASIGANATIMCGVAIGDFAMIGAGAVVTSDVAAHARRRTERECVRGFVCACGGALAFRSGRATCAECSARYGYARGRVTALLPARPGTPGLSRRSTRET